MSEDPILESVRQARAALAAEGHHDLTEIVRRLKARELSEGHRVVRLPPRPVEQPATKDTR